MKATISIELNMLNELSGLVLDKATRLIDKMEECRSKKAHSLANQYHAEAERFMDLYESMQHSIEICEILDMNKHE